MYIWYLFYCLRSRTTTDCAYENTPQAIGIHLLCEKAICSGASGVRAVSIDTLYHSAWVPDWDVLGLNGLKLLLCLNWKDKTR